MAEPMLRAYMPDATAAQITPGPIPGRWIAETSWPLPDVGTRRLYFGAGGLQPTPQAAETTSCSGENIVGPCTVEWVPFAPTPSYRASNRLTTRGRSFSIPSL